MDDITSLRADSETAPISIGIEEGHKKNNPRLPNTKKLIFYNQNKKPTKKFNDSNQNPN
jgi:hypothetical protein